MSILEFPLSPDHAGGERALPEPVLFASSSQAPASDTPPGWLRPGVTMVRHDGVTTMVAERDIPASVLHEMLAAVAASELPVTVDLTRVEPSLLIRTTIVTALAGRSSKAEATRVVLADPADAAELAGASYGLPIEVCTAACGYAGSEVAPGSDGPG